MTAERLKEIRERANKATRPPWIVEENDRYITGYITSEHHRYAGNTSERTDSVCSPGTLTVQDADFIAAARQDVPDLLDEVERLRKALSAIERWELPVTGRTWDDGTPMSYGACWGSNGERDFMRAIARDSLAIKATTNNSPEKPA